MSLRQRGKRASSKARAAGVGLLLTASLPALAARQDAPALHTRTAQRPDAVPAATIATGRTDLPDTAEGEYPWGRLGEEIELFFEGGRLHGYMTQRLDPTNDQSAPVTFDFATTHVDGDAVEWTTRPVHGTSYSFAGHLERGLVASPSLPGFYLLTGTLTTHGGEMDGVARVVRLKREPGTE